MSSKVSYKEGDQVTYHPIGGASDNVASSTGQITSVFDDEGETKYTIRNDNTGKETTYKAMNIVGPAEK
ncbi:hypothetical protein SCHPADRAFT_999460 [Schizopora paradoxa]|uniref:Uncharacterized protein n=1 Tax=Schizopora paradoxa TaxID=27342 RepID=A0A0H2S0N8_9AGAM|nr:hypothetical protein SCHPADRAFT_999460 [Schizopora paradoxa]